MDRARGRAGGDFVRAMPGGLDARIEQGGTNVSGGQRQRLSIARALIRRPDIYVFDDSFSALDLTTDARLRAALVPYTSDAAVVIVAQRVSTIATADDILVLEDGEVIGRGHPRRADPRLPDVRRDRPVADRREERGMTVIDDHSDQEEIDLAAPEVRAAGRWNSAGVPAERSKDFKNALRRLGQMLGRMWIVLAFVAVFAIASAVLNVLGPRVLGDATDVIVDRCDAAGKASTSASCTTCCSRRSCCTSASALLSILAAYLLAGVIQRLMYRLRSDVEDKVNVLPLSYIDKQARGDC